MIIENTGKQFSLHDIEQIAHPDDDEPHIGLNNVSERLRQLCGGTLEVSAREGGGTVVTIKV